MSNFLTLNDLTIIEIKELLQDANQFSKGAQWFPVEKRYAVNLFFEPSTRTKSSFEIAERKLGIEVIPFETDKSSLTKGESLYDTVKTFEAVGVDVAVIRHDQDGFYQELVDNLEIPLINGGDGCGHHPSQSLLDLFTIEQEFGSFENLNVAIVGDIIHSRVARSNAEVLKRLGANVMFSGPKEWFRASYLQAGEYLEIDEVVEHADVCMFLRIQHERHHETAALSKEEYHQRYGLTEEREKRMKKDSIIMHPAPVNRNVEIADKLVECKRSRIFQQIKNGVFVRMAILKKVLSH